MRYRKLLAYTYVHVQADAEMGTEMRPVPWPNATKCKHDVHSAPSVTVM
jgi:hypothetical protein